jgi:hypothetical protein
MLNKALLLCDAAHGSLFTLANGTLHQVAAVRATPQLATLRQQQGPIRLEPGTPFYPLLEGERIVHLTDLRESAAYQNSQLFGNESTPQTLEVLPLWRYARTGRSSVCSMSIDRKSVRSATSRSHCLKTLRRRRSSRWRTRA